MNKKWLFLALSLLLMVAAKNALGQDGSPLSWDPIQVDPTEDVAAVMVAAPILGTIFGVLRLLSVKAFRPVTCLGLQSYALRRYTPPSDARRSPGLR